MVLDDRNVDDVFIQCDLSIYEYLFDGSFEKYAQPGDNVSTERKCMIILTCEAILEAFRQMSQEERIAAIGIAERNIREKGER